MESRTPQHPQPLPDVAHEAAALARPLDWVGMEALALPIRLAGGDASPLLVTAEVDVAVDLRDAGARGIHMSRLYLLLQDQLANEPLTAPGLRRLLDACIASQQGLATRARLRLRYEHLLLRPALVSAHAGWKRYPVEVEAELRDGHLSLWLGLAVDYSSTCPASAALSRQANAARFESDFAGARPLSKLTVPSFSMDTPSARFM